MKPIETIKNEIKSRPLTHVRCGLVFPEYGTMWKVVNYSTGDDLWIVENCFDKSFTHYKKDEEIRKIMGIGA